MIELLVVIAIMTVVMSLVGPMALKQLDKIKASSEWYELALISKKVEQQAFVSSAPVSLAFQGRQLTIIRSNKTMVKNFKYISFPPQNITFDANGFTQTNHIKAYVNRISRELDLRPDELTIKDGNL